jgi:hypothetical protein
MVDATKRNRELVAHPVGQARAVVQTSSDGQARLRGYKLRVSAIAITTRFAQCEGAFINMPRNRVVDLLFGPGARGRQSDPFPNGHRPRRGRISASPPFA